MLANVCERESVWQAGTLNFVRHCGDEIDTQAAGDYPAWCSPCALLTSEPGGTFCATEDEHDAQIEHRARPDNNILTVSENLETSWCSPLLWLGT